MTIRSRIMLILAAACISVIIAGGVGLYGMNRCNQELEGLYKERMSKLILISEIMSLMRDNRIQLLLSLQHDPANPDIAKIHDHPLTMHTDTVTKNIATITSIWEEFAKLRTGAEGKKLADDFASKRMQFVKEGLLPVREAVLAGNFKEATELTIKKVNPLFAPADEAAKALYSQQTKQAKAAYEEALAGYKSGIAIISAVVLIATFVSIMLGVAIIRSISRASDRLIKTSEQLANGDLTVRADLQNSDELGTIAKSFDRMADSFSEVICQVNDSAVQVSAAAAQVLATAERIATGSEEVAAQSKTVATAGEEMEIGRAHA